MQAILLYDFFKYINLFTYLNLLLIFSCTIPLGMKYVTDASSSAEQHTSVFRVCTDLNLGSCILSENVWIFPVSLPHLPRGQIQINCMLILFFDNIKEDKNIIRYNTEMSLTFVHTYT